MMADPFLSPYIPSRTVPARIARRMTQWQTVSPLKRVPARPIITFTFDDFPKSSAEAGAGILEESGARGTYYAASGLAGRELVIGEMYDATDLHRLQSSGHEIGSHTRSHRDCAQMRLSESVTDIELGDRQLLQMGLKVAPRQFAYPYGETTPPLKRRLAGRYDCARGILPGINRKGSDRAQLRAIELGDDPFRITRALNAIRSAVTAPGWVIFFTHDVRPSPSAFGVTPETLKRVVAAARSSGASIETMGSAYTSLRGCRS